MSEWRIVRTHLERRTGWRGRLDTVLRRKPIKVIDEVELVDQRHLAPRPPDDFWRAVPCGHPQDPLAWVTPQGIAVCHCGWVLDEEDAISDGAEESAPGPIVACGKCGCYPAIPKEREWHIRLIP